MTIITVSTVGFEEVKPLSDSGRLFTALLIITSFGTFAYAISSITRYVVTGQYKNYFKDYKVNKDIDKLHGHTIICGFGRNGRQAAKTLQAYRKPFVIIDDDESLIETLRYDQNILFVKGDATNEETLFRAGIRDASAVIATLPKDSDNVFVVLTSRELKKDLTIISRASNESSEKKLRIAGANNVIMPERVGGAHMATLVVSPDVMEFLDHISVIGSHEINLEQINFKQLPADFRYKTIQELEERYKTGARIIGFKNADSDYILNPSPDLELIPNSKLFVLGTSEQIKKLNAIFNIAPEQ